jgi:hypothetical protein
MVPCAPRRLGLWPHCAARQSLLEVAKTARAEQEFEDSRGSSGEFSDMTRRTRRLDDERPEQLSSPPLKRERDSTTGSARDEGR